MDTLTDLFEEQIKDLYSAEKQLLKALPKMAKAASTPELKEAFEQHLNETQVQLERLEQIAETCGFSPTGKVCNGMKGLLEEGTEAIEEDGHPAVVDAGIVAAAQRVEHYEISGYGTAARIAKLIGDEESAKLLGETLEEEKQTDEKLTEVADNMLYPSAEEGEEEEEEMATASVSSKKSSGGKKSSRGK